MNGYRETWMRRMLAREQRMVDMQIMAALQNGTAFFATTSLFAIGGALTILRSSDEMIAIASHLPFGIETSRGLWEAKAIGLTVIFVYAFFKFAWAYRLYNYVAILLGATPLPADKDTPEAEAHVLRTARLFTAAGRHFNRGQRAFFFALGYLGWFAGPLVLIIDDRDRRGGDVVAAIQIGLAARRRGQRNQFIAAALTPARQFRPVATATKPASSTAVAPAATLAATTSFLVMRE